MNVEAVHQLASAIHTSPRLFACVLGSGISRSAGIRTGWEIVLDLVQRHAEQIGEGDACSKNAAAWFAAKYGSEPDYSEVVSQLAPTTDLRRNLLEAYFTQLDPVTGERREHEPTPAHRAIAKLVQRGLLRVIVTTNFDRLMERALRDAGVARVEVVSSESEAADSYPFHASEAFVLKIHGDWRDTWLRNSRAELASYPPALAKLLQRIVDEHGLIVCGWSAEYDVALRDAIAKRERRFPIHWVDPKPGAGTQKLVIELHASQVAAVGDAYFSELELAAAALDRQRPPPPLTGDVLVARARRFIAANNEMELDDLVQDATRALCTWVESGACSLRGDSSTLRARAEQLRSACESQSVPLARLLATLARYRQPSYLAQRSLCALLQSALARAGAKSSIEGDDCFFAYPAMLCAFAHGVVCADKEDWRAAIVPLREAASQGDELHVPPAAAGYFTNLLRAGDAYGPRLVLQFTNHIADWLFPLVESWIPRRKEFERAFDRIDTLIGVLALRPGSSVWLPRCSIARARPASDSMRASFDEVVEEWLIPRLYEGRDQPANEPLFEAVKGIDADYNSFFELVRKWKPS